MTMLQAKAAKIATERSPPTIALGDSQVLFEGMVGLQEDCVLNVKNKSHSVTADITVPDGGARGVIVNQGGVTGGWALYCKTDGRLAYHYSFLGLQRASISSAAAVPEGKHQVRVEFAYDGGGTGKGGDVALYVDDQQVGNGRVERTHAYHYNLTETAGVGRDSGSPVCDDYPVDDNAFSGSIDWVRIDVGKDSHDHLVDPEHLLNLAMARQ